MPIKTNQRFYFVIISFGIAIGVGMLSIAISFEAYLHREKGHLLERVQSQARFMEAVAKLHQEYPAQGFSARVRADTISHIINAQRQFAIFGDTGEFTLAELKQGQIVFLLRHHHIVVDTLDPVSYKSKLAEPMHRALDGESGIIIGVDYRGEKVLAAFEPVAALDLGLVAKIDYSEIKAPFIRAAWISGATGFLIIVVGGVLYFKFNEFGVKANPAGFSIRPKSDKKKLFVAGLLALAILLADLIIPLGVAAGVGYVALVIYFYWFPDSRYIYYSAGVASLFIILGFVFSAPGGEFWQVLLNRFLALFVIWIVAISIYRNKNIETVLKVEEERARNYFDTAGVILIVIEKDQKVSAINQMGCHVLGLQSEEVIGENWFDNFVPKEDRNKVKAVFEDLMRGEVIDLTSYKNNIIVSGGEKKSIVWTNKVLLDKEGSISGILSSGEDVTERDHQHRALMTYQNDLEAMVHQRTIAYKRVNQELEAFSFSVSHDLRAPLRRIIQFGEILTRDHGKELNEKGKNFLIKISLASTDMKQLIEDLMRLSKVNRSELYRVDFDISALVQEVMREFQNDIFLRAIDIAVEDKLRAKGDRNLIKILLVNLLGNAIKFTKNCDNTKIEFGKTSFDHREVFFVRDNGVGFNQNYAGKIFIPFTRLHTDSEFNGTGIGLATAKRIINRHSSEIWAESELGKGTTIYFTLSEIGAPVG